MRRFFSVFSMDLLNLFKNPVLVGYNTVFAAFLLLALGYLSAGSFADIQSAYQYYGVTFIVFGMLNGAMTASNCFMERDIKRPNLRIIYSPVQNSSIWFSKILASFVFDYSLHLLLVLVLCNTLHITLGSCPILFVVLMAPIEFGAAALGTFFCCIFHCEETTSMILSTVVSLLSVLGGTFFSLDGLGSALAFASRLSPVKWLNDAFFRLACDNSTALFLPVLLGACAVSALLVLGCRLTFRTEDYL